MPLVKKIVLQVETQYQYDGIISPPKLCDYYDKIIIQKTCETMKFNATP